jgi:hypothetical protein
MFPRQPGSFWRVDPGTCRVGVICRKDDAEDLGDEPDPLLDFVAKLLRRLGDNLGP